MKLSEVLLAIACGIILGLVSAAGASMLPVSAQSNRGGWTFETCWTNSCIENKLNSLDAERAAEAKLTTWDAKTYVWYRR